MRTASCLVLVVGIMLGGIRPAHSCTAGVSATQGLQEFQLGIAAFRAGQYPQALTDFLGARRHGIRSPQLGYDLGTVYFRLRRYRAARREFQALERDPALAALSQYNLGLIALRLGNPAQARRHFRRAHAGAQEPALRRLAAQALLRAGSAHHGSPTWVGFADVGAGYDSNVALTTENSLIAPARRSSALFQFLTGAVGQLTGNYRRGLQAVATVYKVSYPSVSEFSQTYLHAGGQYHWDSGRWFHTVGFYAGDTSLGGTSFESLATARLATGYALSSRQQLRVSYRYTRIVGGSGYNYLTGWHQALSVEDRMRVGRLDLNLAYTLDLNRRRNLAAPPQFFSVSPTRNGLFAHLRWRVTDTTSLFIAADYQHSHYDLPNVLVSGATTTRLGREDNWQRFDVGMDRRLAHHWTLRADWRYSDNRSNITLYSYQSRRLELSLEYLFP